jgi:4-pyridoxolactonase
MTETKVYLLDGGTLVMDGLHAFWNAGPTGAIRFPCYSALIEHQDGYYIYDTGYDLDHVQRALAFTMPMQAKEQTIPGQSLLGLRPQDINYVINSHFHFDHCGGNKHLSRACTVCHAKALEACACPQPFEVQSYSDLSFAPEIAEGRGVPLPPSSAEAEIYTPTFQTIAGDQEIAKGIRLFETTGHAAGHYSMLVELSHRRPMLFTGDAAYSQRNLDRMIISSFHLDPVGSYKSMQRLKELLPRPSARL